MQASVILATYEAPIWLEKVLWGYHAQTLKDFELVIADDGSGPETKELIERIRAETGMRIKHVWHEDDGFRKCEILNKGILKAQSDYLVFSDGDCIPRNDFLEEHAKHAKPGLFLTGSYIRLPMDTSERITKEDILSGRCFNWSWLVDNGLPINRKTKKLKPHKRWAELLNRLAIARTNFKGGNSSAWKADVLAINGFDQRMQWGGLDREFGVRLKNAGLKARHIRYNTHMLHLDHARAYKDVEQAKRNKSLRKKNRQNGIVKTEHGINLLTPE